MAFARNAARSVGIQDVWVQPLSGGAARQLTFGKYLFCSGLSWTPDGKEIVFSGWSAEGKRMVRARLTGGPPQPVAGVGLDALSGGIRGDRMVYVQTNPSPQTIFRLPGRQGAERDRVPTPLVEAAGVNANAAYSPDGRKIAFASGRGGILNIWVSEAEGSHPVQLTTFETGEAGTPRSSPDGRRLVFDSTQAGNYDLYVIDVDGGVPRRPTTEPSEEGTGTWSRDGRFIYFHSDRSGRFELWKLPCEGGAASR